MNKGKKGLLFVISGPSGVGKGTICNYLREKYPDFIYSVSVTTRKPRVGELEGINYFFRTKEEFEVMIQDNELLEWAEYVNNYYGTPRKFVEDNLNQGKDVLLEIEIQGALKVKNNFPEGIFIFLLPPSLNHLSERIVGRGTESEELIKLRLEKAKQELTFIKHYNYVVVNDQLEKAIEQINAIRIAEHCKITNTEHLYENLENL